RLRQGRGGVRRRGRGGERAGQAQRRDRARQACDRGRAALSVGHPHLSRRRRAGLELASALFRRGFALAQGVTMGRLGLVGVLALVLGAATPLRAQTASALPPGEGRDLVATACSQCHTLNVIMAGRDGPVGWKKHVYNMVLRGAQLTPREADTVIPYLNPHFRPGAPDPLIQYLSASFGPGAPAATAAALPSGPGKELVETRCAVCHNLERVTVVKRQKRDWETVVANMYERLGMSAPDEVQAISAYL